MNKSWNIVREDIERLVKIKPAVTEGGKIIDIEAAAAKEAEIKNLLALRKQLVITVDEIDSKIDGLHKAVMLDRVNMIGSLEKAGIRANIASKSPPKRAPPTPAPIMHVQHTSDIDVPFTKNMSLRAAVVFSQADIKKDGCLYYIQELKCLGIRIAGVLYRGNIGRIFNNEKAPSKVKECKFGNRCMHAERCDYYHGPPDIRNYAANSWIYATNGRKFGSRDTLDIDIGKVSAEDARRSADQLMHDLLCNLLLQKYRSVAT